MTKVFIMEAIPSLNKGEGIILRGLIRSLEPVRPIEISLLSYYPQVDALPSYPEVTIIGAPTGLMMPQRLPERRRWTRIACSAFACLQHMLFGVLCRSLGQRLALRLMNGPVWRAYCDSDVVIVGHDSLLQTPFGGTLHFLYIYVAWLAKILDKPVVVYAGTIGFSANSQGAAYHRLARFIRPVWRNIDLIMVRDAASACNLQTMGVSDAKVHVTADVAFLAPAADCGRALEILESEGVQPHSGPLVGVTLTYMITKRAAPELTNDTRGRFVQGVRLIAKTIDTLVRELDATFVFLPHCIEPGHRDDRKVARDVYAQVAPTNHVYLIEREYTPEELKSVIGCCDLFLGERTHSVISAVSMGVPAVNLSHTADQRAYSLLAEVLGKRVMFIEDASVTSLTQMLINAWNTRERVICETEVALQPVLRRAWKNGLLFKELLDGAS